MIKENIASEVSQLKQEQGRDLALFGSANLTVSLLQMGLIDELRIMVNRYSNLLVSDVIVSFRPS